MYLLIQERFLLIYRFLNRLCLSQKHLLCALKNVRSWLENS